MIKIIEKHIAAKTYDFTRCEDGLFINEDYIAVIDGATAKGKLNWENKTSGNYAKEILLQAMETLDSKCTPQAAITYLNNALREAYKDRLALAEQERVERLQASIIIYSRDKKQVWSFGDCQCMIAGKIYQHIKEVDELLSNMRSLYLSLELIKGKTVDELQSEDLGRKYILPLLENQNMLANINSEWGYPVLDGFPIHADYIKIYDVDTHSEVIMASDGYPFLKNTLIKSENALAEVIKNDVLCIKEYKSTKGIAKNSTSFDDRTYIRFIV